MVAYYEARAAEYDDWYLRRGRYERGPVHDVAWAAELDEAGRDPIPVTLSGATPDPALIERGEEAGVHRCAFYIEPADAGETERQLDELASTFGL